MLVLSLDTTTREGSCALARDGRVLREQGSDAAKPQAARLPGDLVTLLEHEGVTLADVDIYAVSTGPGSFTGLRVGIATMQGLAFAAGKPLIGISALDALQAQEHVHVQLHGARVATWIDAWRGEIYAALYENGQEVEPPSVAHPDELLPPLAGRPTLFIGDGAGTYADTIRAALGADATIADPVTPLLAGSIAQLATEAARAGHLPPPHAIRPIYVRRPDPPSPLGGFGAASSRRAV
jgi:tRNA threonylcarbamoyladenosine biosynthesis protein TsaB